MHAIRLSLVAVVALTLGLGTVAAEEIGTQRTQCAKDIGSAWVQGRIKGYEAVDDPFGARKGQVANTRLGIRHSTTCFHLPAPGQTEAAPFNGSTSENPFEGALPESGAYRIRVYMMRSAARRNVVADYGLEFIIAATPSAAAVPSTDAKVTGIGFHAIGNVPCAMGDGQPTASCPFKSSRRRDLMTVQIGNERYEIPDAVVNGG